MTNPDRLSVVRSSWPRVVRVEAWKHSSCVNDEEAVASSDLSLGFFVRRAASFGLDNGY